MLRDCLLVIASLFIGGAIGMAIRYFWWERIFAERMAQVERFLGIDKLPAATDDGATSAPASSAA